MVGSCGHGNECSDSMQCKKFFLGEELLAYQEGLCFV